MRPLTDFMGRSSRSTFLASVRKALLLAAALSAHGVGAAGVEEPPSWALSGFGTVGLTSKTGAPGWGFARDQGQKGAGDDISGAVDTRAGLQLNWNGGAKW